MPMRRRPVRRASLLNQYIFVSSAILWRQCFTERKGETCVSKSPLWMRSKTTSLSAHSLNSEIAWEIVIVVGSNRTHWLILVRFRLLLCRYVISRLWRNLHFILQVTYQAYCAAATANRLCDYSHSLFAVFHSCIADRTAHSTVTVHLRIDLELKTRPFAELLGSE